MRWRLGCKRHATPHDGCRIMSLEDAVQILLCAGPHCTFLRRRQRATLEDLHQSRSLRLGGVRLHPPAHRCPLNNWGKQDRVLRVLALEKFRRGLLNGVRRPAT